MEKLKTTKRTRLEFTDRGHFSSLSKATPSVEKDEKANNLRDATFTCEGFFCPKDLSEWVLYRRDLKGFFRILSELSSPLGDRFGQTLKLFSERADNAESYPTLFKVISYLVYHMISLGLFMGRSLLGLEPALRDGWEKG